MVAPDKLTAYMELIKDYNREKFIGWRKSQNIGNFMFQGWMWL